MGLVAKKDVILLIDFCIDFFLIDHILMYSFYNLIKDEKWTLKLFQPSPLTS